MGRLVTSHATSQYLSCFHALQRPHSSQSDHKYPRKQIARLTREETLGSLPIRLSSGKMLSLNDLRGTARVVLAAGTRAQVRVCPARELVWTLSKCFSCSRKDLVWLYAIAFSHARVSSLQSWRVTA